MYLNVISFYICFFIVQVYTAPANNVMKILTSRIKREAAPHTPNGQLAFGSQSSAVALAQAANVNYGYSGGLKGTNQLGGQTYPAQTQYYRPNNNCCGNGGGGKNHNHQHGWQNGGGWNNNPGTGGSYPAVYPGHKGTASGSASGSGQFSESSANANTQHFNSGGTSGSASSSSAHSVSSSNNGYYGGNRGGSQSSAVAHAQAK